MSNGLNIHIGKDEFLSKPVGDQNWLLFEGISQINTQGCSYGKQFHKKEKWAMAKVIGASLGAGAVTAIAVIAALWKMFF